MSYSLFIDCSSEILSLALADRERLLTQISSNRLRSHNEELGIFVQKILSEQGVEASGLSQIFFGAGPGSFTGLRIGLSFCCGLCAANPGTRLILQSSFYGYLSAVDLSRDTRWVTLADAGREEYFVAVIDLIDGQLSEYLKPAIISKKLLISSLEDWRVETKSLALRGLSGSAEGLAGYQQVSAGEIASNLARINLAGYQLPCSAAANLSELTGLSPLYLRKVAARTLAERASAAIPGA